MWATGSEPTRSSSEYSKRTSFCQLETGSHVLTRASPTCVLSHPTAASALAQTMIKGKCQSLNAMNVRTGDSGATYGKEQIR